MKLSINVIYPFVLGVATLLLTGTASLVAADSSVGRVQVMDVDDVRDAATIARAKAQNRSQAEDNDGSAGNDSFSSGCSDLNIGNVKTSVGQQVPRNVTVVIEGPVIQENKCR